MFRRLNTWCLLFFCLVVLDTATLFAQSKKYRFQKITTQEGLPDNLIHGMTFSEDGFLWLATHDGFSRYDGKDFKTYRHIQGDSTSLSGHVIMDVKEDTSGMLWIAANGGGLNRFDPITETFKSFLPEADNPKSLSHLACTKIFIDSEETVWVGTFDGGLNRFNPTTETFDRFPLISETELEQLDGFSYNSVRQIIEDVDKPNVLWIAHNNGLARLNKKTGNLEKFPFLKEEGNLEFHDLWMENERTIWVSSLGAGLLKFNPKNNSFQQYLLDTKAFRERTDFTQNRILSIAPKSPNELWLASLDDGLLIFNKVTELFEKIKNDPQDQFSISENDIYGLHVDDQSRLWIRTNQTGINLLDPASQIFDFNSLQLTDCQNKEVVPSGIAFDESRKLLYVTASGCGKLFVFEKKYGAYRLKYLAKAASNIPASHQFNQLTITANGRIFLAGIGEGNYSLFEFFPDRQVYEVVEKEAFIHDFEITDLLTIGGNVWMGTNWGGLIKWNIQNGEFTPFYTTESGFDFRQMKTQFSQLSFKGKSALWLSTLEHGVFKFDLREEKFKHFPYLEEENVGLDAWRILAVLPQENGKAWVGTSALGIQIIDEELPAEQRPENFNHSNGLTDNKISGIVNDKNGNIWISTMKGLNRLDKITGQVVSYSIRDGLSSNYLEQGIVALSTGEIVILQKNGFQLFNPEKLYKNLIPPKVVLTGLKILENEKEFEKNINHIDQITLNHDENFFSFHFAALNFSQPEKNRYAFQLEGIDPNWILPNDQRNFASYTNVDPGVYTFKVKAANNSGVWNEEGTQIKIKILQPWYWTSIFKLFYLVLGAGVVYFLYTFQRKRWDLQTQLSLEQNEAQRLKELDELKNKLYTNITHEFRTPLTVIIGMADQIKNNDQAKRMIESSSKNLLLLVNRILDLSKIEAGKMGVKNQFGNIVKYIQYLSESFYSLAKEKNIVLTFYNEEDVIDMDFDEEKIKQIIDNLIYNAIKFTPEKGKIILHVAKNNDHLQIKCKDSGIGIAKENLDLVFNRFFQVDGSSTRAEEGTGIGLALVKELVSLLNGEISVKSELGKGTEFLLLLPIKKEANKAFTNWAQPSESEIKSEKVIPVFNEEFIPAINEINENKIQILLAEDNKDVAEFITTILKDKYQIHYADNGQKGIDMALELMPDLIISDVMMPLKNGYELCNQLKSNDKTSYIPIILLTAKVLKEDKIEGLEKGADAYIAKPFDKQELFLTIENFITLREGMQKKYSDTAFAKTPIKVLTKEEKFLRNLKEFILAKIDDPDLAIVHLCKNANLSQTQLHRKLKALTGETPAKFIRTIRLNHARELLKTSEMNVSEVAYEVGFKDPNYFTRSFSEKFGLTPRQMKNKV